jgi:CubicO group peptidase (beta-lactamase class C family)
MSFLSLPPKPYATINFIKEIRLCRKQIQRECCSSRSCSLRLSSRRRLRRKRNQTIRLHNPATTATAAASDAAALARIETALEARRRELNIPGMSLAIVKDDKVIYAKGLGVKDFERQIPVTPDTLFAIGSSTKAFTAMTAVMSQDDGKLSLGDSPKKLLPYFKLQDPEADGKITIRDLLSHRSGLNRTELAWITGRLNREEIIRVAGLAKPTAKLGEKFLYQNVMYTARARRSRVLKKPRGMM